jgi:hypothetical protein
MSNFNISDIYGRVEVYRAVNMNSADLWAMTQSIVLHNNISLKIGSISVKLVLF